MQNYRKLLFIADCTPFAYYLLRLKNDSRKLNYILSTQSKPVFSQILNGTILPKHLINFPG